MEFKDYKIRTEAILKREINARNSDGSLIAHYINDHFPGLVQNGSVSLMNFKKMPPFESIIRARRQIQNGDKMYPPTDPEVIKARRIKYFNYTNAEIREAKNR